MSETYIPPDFKCVTCGRKQFNYLELADLIECTYCMEVYAPIEETTKPSEGEL
jgi:uncharacterized OB-fold protein